MKYFPYLRGKQFELIALRDMCSFYEQKDIISPIIEPIKQVNSTLLKTIDCLVQNTVNFNIILNPKCGEVSSENYDRLILDVINKLDGYDNYQPTFIINEQVNLKRIISIIKDLGLENISLVITAQPRNESDFKALLDSTSIRYAILYDDSSIRRLSRNIRPLGTELVILADRFNLKEKNADYVNPSDEFFSDDHLFFEKEGYSGYGDYITIGNNYNEGGFLPYAVAIHLTYLDGPENIFRIHHFVSDSNDDNSDVPGKVAEALSKLVPFIDERKMNTDACRQLRQIYHDESYPGLGSIKKLSILNHLQLVYNLFSAK
ncbi:sce7725 family protein [uncultured Alistipes sp.]|uniref:sce7725 family protein n=1 Tax=uncultured Alistipes sp. TaxID=538949 RepID=UPI00260A4A2F|nr:sce7725 family protein [uncultured Alistipes sp.]